MTALAEVPNQPDIPQRKRYEKLDFNVTTINEQIVELKTDNEKLEDGVEAWEEQIVIAQREIKLAKRQITKNEREIGKLRDKRGIVAKAAFDAAAIDQP